MMSENIRDYAFCGLKVRGIKNFEIIFKGDFCKKCLEFFIFKGIFFLGKKGNDIFDAFAEIFEKVLGLSDYFAANNLSHFNELTL